MVLLEQHRCYSMHAFCKYTFRGVKTVLVDDVQALALQAWTLLGSIDGDDWQVLQQVYDDASLGDGGASPL